MSLESSSYLKSGPSGAAILFLCFPLISLLYNVIPSHILCLLLPLFDKIA